MTIAKDSYATTSPEKYDSELMAAIATKYGYEWSLRIHSSIDRNDGQVGGTGMNNSHEGQSGLANDYSLEP